MSKDEAPTHVDVVSVAHDNGCLIKRHRTPTEGTSSWADMGGLELSIDKIEINLGQEH